VRVNGKDGAIGRQAPRRTGRGFVVSFGEGRVCETPTCNTILSRYNDRPRCAVHLNLASPQEGLAG